MPQTTLQGNTITIKTETNNKNNNVNNTLQNTDVLTRNYYNCGTATTTTASTTSSPIQTSIIGIQSSQSSTNDYTNGCSRTIPISWTTTTASTTNTLNDQHNTGPCTLLQVSYY